MSAGAGHLEIAGQNVEDAGHVGCALNVGVSAQGIHAAAGASHVAHQQLQHRRGADDLRAEAVLRPADGVDDGRHLLHVSILADGGEHVGSLQELVFGNAGDALDHLRRVARVLLLQQLIDAARMLQRQIVGDVRRQRRRRNRAAAHGLRSGRTLRLIALAFRTVAASTVLRRGSIAWRRLTLGAP